VVNGRATMLFDRTLPRNDPSKRCILVKGAEQILLGFHGQKPHLAKGFFDNHARTVARSLLPNCFATTAKLVGGIAR